MRFHIFAVIITITLVDGRPPVINEDAWNANNDTAPLIPREYPMLKFQPTFHYGDVGIAEKSPLQCYDGIDVKCGLRFYRAGLKQSCRALAIIRELR